MSPKVNIIINPASGPDYPILAVINRFLQKQKIDWEIAITKEAWDASRFAKDAIKSGAGIVVAVGGDGTVMEIGHALSGSDIPMLIIPAGTANVMSKELNIPQDPNQAIELLRSVNHKIMNIDTALMDNQPFAIRITTGILARSIIDTSREAKDKLGHLAYTVSTIKNLGKIKTRNFHLILDGKKMDVVGNALMIANVGNIGIPGVSIFPNINVTDGKLDVIVFTQADFAGLLSIFKGIVTQDRPSTLTHWQVKKVTVETNTPMHVLLDDIPLKSARFTAEIATQKIKVIVPR